MNTKMKTNKCVHIHLSPGVVSSRVFREAESVLRLGLFHEVIYYCLWEKGLKLEEINCSGLKIRRISTLVRKIRAAGFMESRSSFRKIMAAISLLEMQIKFIHKIFQDKPTHICCHNVQLLPIAVLSGLISGSRIIYSPHELESEVSFLNNITKKIYFLIESLFIRYCHHVVVVNERIMDWYIEKFKINSIDFVRSIPAYLPAVNKGCVLRNEFGIREGELIYIYQGLLGKDRGIKEISEAFDLKQKAHVVFMGYGEMVDFVLHSAKKNPNIHYKPAVKTSQIIETTSSADVGIHYICGNLPISYELSLPNKYFEYLYAGIPMIVSSDLKYLAELVLKYDLGWVVKCGELAGLIDQIDRSTLEAKRESITRYVSENAWLEEEKKFINIYK